MHPTFTAARIWNARPSSRPAPDSNAPPSEAEREEWKRVMVDERSPDRVRAACAMALLYDGQKEEATVEEIAEMIGWPLNRTRAAMEAAVEAGWTRRTT